MSNLRKEFDLFDKLFSKLKLEDINELENLELHEDYPSFLVKTNLNHYCIIKYPKSIFLKEDINNYKEQLKEFTYLNNNGVPTILPLEFNNEYFIPFKNHYYLIYKYQRYYKISNSLITDKQIKKIANIQAIIHKLDLKCSFNYKYKKTNIKFNKYAIKFSNKKKELHDIIYANIYLLTETEKKCNESLKYALNKLCLGIDNYNLNNIDWLEDLAYLINYKDLIMVNPTISLIESAYEIAKVKEVLNTKRFSDYLKAYIKKYGIITQDFKDSLYAALNNKFILLEESLKNSLKMNDSDIKKSISLIEDIINYTNNINEFYEIYLDIIKK